MKLTPRINAACDSLVDWWNSTTEILGLQSNPAPGVNRPGGETTRPPRGLVWYAVFLVAAILLVQGLREGASDEIPYSMFLQYLQEQRIDQVLIEDQFITGLMKPEPPGTTPRPFVTTPLWNHELATVLQKQGVTYTVRRGGNWLATFIVAWLLPLALMFMFWGWMMRRMGGAGGFLSRGRARARIRPESTPKVTFDDVAGADDAKQELRETIEFLKDPRRMQRLGGRMPKGVLLVGRPDTGKTLLARAVSGEAAVPLFNISGSEFIEMFGGLGASRVRDLFDQARQKAPCIIFIDELDAIGRSRGGPVVMGGAR